MILFAYGADQTYHPVCVNDKIIPGVFAYYQHTNFNMGKNH